MEGAFGCQCFAVPCACSRYATPEGLSHCRSDRRGTLAAATACCTLSPRPFIYRRGACNILSSAVVFSTTESLAYARRLFEPVIFRAVFETMTHLRTTFQLRSWCQRERTPNKLDNVSTFSPWAKPIIEKLATEKSNTVVPGK